MVIKLERTQTMYCLCKCSPMELHPQPSIVLKWSSLTNAFSTAKNVHNLLDEGYSLVIELGLEILNVQFCELWSSSTSMTRAHVVSVLPRDIFRASNSSHELSTFPSFLRCLKMLLLLVRYTQNSWAWN